MTRITELPTAVRDPQTYAIIGAAMEVHCRLGPGFLEPVYQESLLIELEHRGIPAVRETQFPVHYRGVQLSSTYRADLVCYKSVIVEIKAQRSLGRVDEAQVINYLSVSRLPKGLLLNFGVERLDYRRFVNDLRHLRHLRPS